MKRTKTNIPADQLEYLLHLAFSGNGGYIRVNKSMLRYYGDGNITIVLANLVNKYSYFLKNQKLDQDGAFFQTHKQQANELGLKEETIKRAKKILKKDGVLEIKWVGVPAKEFYKLNLQRLVELIFSGSGKFDTLGSGKFDTLGSGKFDTHNKNKYNNTNKDTKVSYGQAQLVHINEIEKIISFWNSLPNTQKHQSTNTKVYKASCSILDDLLSGRPINAKKDGTARSKLQRFASDFNIPEELLSKSWAQEEIKDILQTIHDAYLSPRKRQSLLEVFWQEFARKNRGYSLFLTEAIKKNIPNKYLKLVDMFAKDSDNIPKRHNWAYEFQILVEKENKPFDELKTLIQWHCANCHKKYVPKADDPIEFCDKYNKIKRAMNNGYDKEQEKTTSNASKTPPKKLIKESVPEKQAGFWLHTYETAKSVLTTSSNGHLPDLAQNIINMKEKIEKAQSKHTGSRASYYQRPAYWIIEDYCFWLSNRSWLKDIKPNIFDLNHKIFQEYYLPFCTEDNEGGNPITGEFNLKGVK